MMNSYHDENDRLLMKIIKLNKILNNYEYGYMINSNNVVDNGFDQYKTINPETFNNNRCGVCWDYVEYEALKFESLRFELTLKDLKDREYSLYYMQHETIDGDKPTHTWLGFNLNNRIYGFESSWKRFMGINQFDNEIMMIKQYINNQYKYYSKLYTTDYLQDDVLIMKFNKHHHFNLTTDEYMNDMIQNGQVINLV